MTEWRNRPLDAVYPVMFIDAIMVKVRDGQVTQPADLRRDRGHRATGNATSSGCGPATAARAPSSGCRCSPRSRTAASQDVCIVVCDGLKGLPDGDHHGVAADDRPDVRHPPAAQHVPVRVPEVLGPDRPGSPAGLHRADRGRSAGPVRRVRREVGQAVPGDHPALAATPGRSSCRSWTTTSRSAGSSAPPTRSSRLNARYRRAVRARGHFPNEQAALKCLYLVTRSLDPTGRGRARWAMRWKPALNAFAITFEGRINPAGN